MIRSTNVGCYFDELVWFEMRFFALSIAADVSTSLLGSPARSSRSPKVRRWSLLPDGMCFVPSTSFGRQHGGRSPGPRG